MSCSQFEQLARAQASAVKGPAWRSRDSDDVALPYSKGSTPLHEWPYAHIANMNFVVFRDGAFVDCF